MVKEVGTNLIIRVQWKIRRNGLEVRLVRQKDLENIALSLKKSRKQNEMWNIAFFLYVENTVHKNEITHFNEQNS